MNKMARLLYPYMDVAKDDGSDLTGKTEAELAAARGDALEELVEETEEEIEAREAAEALAAEEEEAVVAGDKKKPAAKKDDDDEEEEVVEKPKKQAQVIPKARFDELNTKTKATIAALTETVQRLESGAKKDAEVQSVEKLEEAIAGLDAEVEALLADDKNKEATAKMRDIRALERKITDLRTSSMSDQARSVAVEQVRVDLLIESLEQEYPVLNPKSDEYDEDQVEEIMFLRQSFEKNGLSSSKAIAKAVQLVFVNKVAAADEATKEKKGEKEEKKGLKKDTEADRKAAAVLRNAKDAKKIPARGDGGLDSDKKGGGISGAEVPGMTDEEFAALPESTKARARGDFIE